jgi:hypothetical protein
MSAVASSHDIVTMPIPENTFISGNAPTADYAEAVVGPMNYRIYKSIEQVEEHAFHKGDEVVHRDDHEVVYRGKAPGLNYQISYILDTDVYPTRLIVATTVRTRNRLGRAYWLLVKPIHKLVVPVALDRMLQEAPLN